MKRFARFSFAAISALIFSLEASAAIYTFNTSTLPLPLASGTGLTGQLWTNVNPNTDTLAQAQAIISGGYATANFLATTIDYPNGPAGSTSVGATYSSVLDTTAKATLDIHPY